MSCNREGPYLEIHNEARLRKWSLLSIPVALNVSPSTAVVGLILYLFLSNRIRTLAWKPAALAVIISLVASAIVSPWPLIALASSALLLAGLFASKGIYARDLARDTSWLGSGIAIGVVISAVSVIRQAGLGIEVTGLTFHKNVAAAVLTVGLFGLMSVLIRPAAKRSVGHRLLRLTWLLSILVGLTGLMCTGSRGGVASLLFGVLVYFIARSRPGTRAVTHSVIILIAACALGGGTLFFLAPALTASPNQPVVTPVQGDSLELVVSTGTPAVPIISSGLDLDRQQVHLAGTELGLGDTLLVNRLGVGVVRTAVSGFEAFRRELGGRVGYWEYGFGLVAQRPLLGYGYGTVGALFDSTSSQFLGMNVTHPHSLYIELLLQGGVVALFAFSWLGVQLVWNVISVRSSNQRGSAAMVLASLAALLFQSTIDPILGYGPILGLWWLTYCTLHGKHDGIEHALRVPSAHLGLPCRFDGQSKKVLR